MNCCSSNWTLDIISAAEVRLYEVSSWCGSSVRTFADAIVTVVTLGARDSSSLALAAGTSAEGKASPRAGLAIAQLAALVP